MVESKVFKVAINFIYGCSDSDDDVAAAANNTFLRWQNANRMEYGAHLSSPNAIHASTHTSSENNSIYRPVLLHYTVHNAHTATYDQVDKFRIFPSDRLWLCVCVCNCQFHKSHIYKNIGNKMRHSSTAKQTKID